MKPSTSSYHQHHIFLIFLPELLAFRNSIKLELCIISSSISRKIPIDLVERKRRQQRLVLALVPPPPPASRSRRESHTRITYISHIHTNPSPPRTSIPYLLSSYVHILLRTRTSPPDLSIDQSTITQSPNSIKSGPVFSVSLSLFWLAGPPPLQVPGSSVRTVHTVAVRYYIVPVPTLIV